MNKEQIKTLLWNQTQGHCWYCGCTVSVKPEITKYTAIIEHQTPLRMDGTDAIENLVLACFSCNSIKRSKTLNEYRFMVTCQKIQGGDTWAYYQCLKTAINLAPNSHKPSLQRYIDKIEDYVAKHQHHFYGESLNSNIQAS